MNKYRKPFFIITVVFVLFTAITVIIILNRPKKDDKHDSIFTQSDKSIEELQQTEQTPTTTPTTTPALVDTEVVSVEYDYEESLEDYLNSLEGDSKVKIQGSGTPWVYGMIDGKEMTELLEEEGVEIIGNPVETQKYWYQLAQSPKYVFRVNDKFKAIPSIKYDIVIKGITNKNISFEGPNRTHMILTMVDDTKENVRASCLADAGFGYYDSVCDAEIPYNTDFELGVGLTGLDIYTEYGNQQDITISSNGSQIYVDTEIHTFVGDCYYMEYYSHGDSLYHAILVTEIGGNTYYIKAYSEERSTLKDICSACIDRCLVV